MYPHATYLGLAIKVMNEMHANGFMMVSRVAESPATFHVISMGGDGVIKEWRGTMSDAYDAVEGRSR